MRHWKKLPDFLGPPIERCSPPPDWHRPFNSSFARYLPNSPLLFFPFFRAPFTEKALMGSTVFSSPLSLRWSFWFLELPSLGHFSQSVPLAPRSSEPSNISRFLAILGSDYSSVSFPSIGPCLIRRSQRQTSIVLMLGFFNPRRAEFLIQTRSVS